MKCCYANYKLAACVATYTVCGPTVAKILSNIMSSEELEADALLRKYQEFIDDDDFDLPQQQWRIKKKPVFSAEVLERRAKEKARKEASREAYAAKRTEAWINRCHPSESVKKARTKRAAATAAARAKRKVALASKREPPKKRARKD